MSSNSTVPESDHVESQSNRELLLHSQDMPDPELVPDPPSVHKISKPWLHFVAGGVGGMAGAICTCPFDVVKTRLQSDFYQARVRQIQHKNISPISGALLHFKETGQILTDVYRQEGPRALFKGLGPNLVGVIPARSINFFTYGNGKSFIANHFNNGKEAAWVHLIAASVAGIVTSTATNPIWLVKTRLQLDKKDSQSGVGQRRYTNSWDCIKQVVRSEGIKGLYKGLTASYLGVVESSLQWVLYEQMKHYIKRRQDRRRDMGFLSSKVDSINAWFATSGAAGAAKLLASLITYPHEVIRTRMRQRPTTLDGKPKYTGLVQCFKLIWKEEGAAALYGGLTPHLMRTVPNSFIMFGVFEIIVKNFS